jgi:hypothetical protein
MVPTATIAAIRIAIEAGGREDTGDEITVKEEA